MTGKEAGDQTEELIDRVAAAPTGRRASFRSVLSAFRKVHGGAPSPGFLADLAYLENRDLDLSIRIGAMLAFNALMVTIGTHPVSASPGAPLSVDATEQPLLTIASIAGVVPFALSSLACLRALLIGEEFDHAGHESVGALRQRLIAAFVRSIDAQARFLRHAITATMAGGAATLAVWAWILAKKMAAA